MASKDSCLNNWCVPLLNVLVTLYWRMQLLRWLWCAVDSCVTSAVPVARTREPCLNIWAISLTTAACYWVSCPVYMHQAVLFLKSMRFVMYTNISLNIQNKLHIPVHYKIGVKCLFNDTRYNVIFCCNNLIHLFQNSTDCVMNSQVSG